MSRSNRRLSVWRVLLAIVLLAGLIGGGAFAAKVRTSIRSTASAKPWYAAYVDVTSTPAFAFDQMGATANRDALLSFIVASPSEPCTPTWGGAYNLDQAGSSLDLDRRIARLKQQGGNIAISFGGQKNDELAINCSDSAKLLKAYSSVIDRYNISTIDLDLEGTGLANKAAGERRASVLSELQTQRRHSGKELAIWVTLPVTPQGLAENGTNAVSQLLGKKVDIAGLNVMTMDYGSSRDVGQTMQTASESAMTQSVRQLGILYQTAGIHLNSATLWSKIGATPMIGQNDEAKDIFTLADAEGFNRFALSHRAGRMSMWSANRDLTCGSNYVDTKVVSDSCSGINQGNKSFAAILSAGFKGNLTTSAKVVTISDQNTSVQKPDDPAASPYQIWSASGTYLQGTKIVWHHNVYQAKWWTQSDTPDNPVLQTWQTPWELVGPVLAGEKLIPQATLPQGTFPDWAGTGIYDVGQRVLFNNVPYQAKWWTQGQSPAASSSNPNGSPWAPLTQSQINELTAKQ